MRLVFVTIKAVNWQAPNITMVMIIPNNILGIWGSFFVLPYLAEYPH